MGGGGRTGMERQLCCLRSLGTASAKLGASCALVFGSFAFVISVFVAATVD